VEVFRACTCFPAVPQQLCGVAAVRLARLAHESAFPLCPLEINLWDLSWTYIVCVCVCLWDTVVMVLLYLFFANPAFFCAIIDDLGRALDLLRKLCPELLHHQSRST